MEITEVRIKLMDDPHDRLQGFCSITFDSKFVIRDLKIIQGGKGSFVAMPSRKLTDRCPRCNTKNHLRALYCNQCGTRLSEDRAEKDYDGRAKLYADIAHPINSECREQIQQEVLKAFELEIVRAKQPGYVCTYDDYGEDNYAAVDEEYEAFVAGSSRGPKRDEAARRIEPAVSQPAGPHHNLAARTREKTATAASHRTASSQSDDEFGTGL